MEQDIRALALEEAALKALSDEIGDRLKATRAAMQEALDSTGAGSVAAVLPGGLKVATISVTDPKPEAVVTDSAAFRAWVQSVAPSEVTKRFLTEVRPAYVKTTLAQMTAAGTPVWADPETGEVHDVPGVEIRATRARGHSVRPVVGGREAIAEAWRSGALGALGLPVLGAGPAQAAAGTETAA